MFKDPCGRPIKWEHIKLLHKIQSEEGLSFANKLGIRHIDFANQKMKVRLAAQVLSSSVADAIQFMMDCKVPGFEVIVCTSYPVLCLGFAT